MEKISHLQLCGRSVREVKCSVVVLGSGAAGLNCMDSLLEKGVDDAILVTEGINIGTSVNTGSDKQTYYKQTTFGDESDSVCELAQTLFSCGCMEGFHALNEASRSLECFYKLTSIGVAFPKNEYGEYVGYRTDHDHRKRATSCGPLTSKYMCEKLLSQLRRKNARIVENLRAVKIFTKDGGVCGLLCVDSLGEYTLFEARHLVLATGGEAGIYSASVYPQSQTGSLGLALEVGACAVNLTEWQYGIASIGFRWNLSGTYMQVIPRFVSIDEEGVEREFLHDYLGDDSFNAVFMKGYNWPFSPEKLCGAKSSHVDIAVFAERQKGRRVYLDYTKNPSDFTPKHLSEEAYSYLVNSDVATLATPIERLRKMNERAYRLYLDSAHIDLERDYLEIDVCAQHCNGGIKVDRFYRVCTDAHYTPIDGLYAIGECAGVFGVKRPGGTALASSQVTSLCVAEHIASSSSKRDNRICLDEVRNYIGRLDGLCQGDSTLEDLLLFRKKCSDIMSGACAFIRDEVAVKSAIGFLETLLADFSSKCSTGDRRLLRELVINHDILLSALTVARACLAYIQGGYKSRGGFAIGSYASLDEITLEEDCESLINISISEAPAIDATDTHTVDFNISLSKTTPIPTPERWFEKVYT